MLLLKVTTPKAPWGIPIHIPNLWSVGEIQDLGDGVLCSLRNRLNIRRSLPICQQSHSYHSFENMTSGTKNDIDSYKSIFRDHPLRRRADIPDDLHLWLLSRQANRMNPANAMDIPLVSETQESIPLVHRSEIHNPTLRYPLHSTFKSMKTLSEHPLNWILKHIALHVGTITEIDADAVVIGTDSSMTSFQLSSQHIYSTSMQGISNSLIPHGTASCLSRLNKSSRARRVSSSTNSNSNMSMDERNSPFLSKSPQLIQDSILSPVCHPVGTIKSSSNVLNCAALVSLLIVQPAHSDEQQYKLCIRNILNEMRSQNHRSLVLPILGVHGMHIHLYSAVRWTLEEMRDWFNENDTIFIKQTLSGTDGKRKKQDSITKELPLSAPRIILILEDMKHWRLVHEMVKIVLCGDRSPLVPIKPQRWRLAYSLEKQNKRATKIPTGEEALRMVVAKERNKQDQKKKLEATASRPPAVQSVSEAGRQCWGGRQRGCGDYKPILQSKIIELGA